jgi:uncharacterized protein (TIGR00730 family)
MQRPSREFSHPFRLTKNAMVAETVTDGVFMLIRNVCVYCGSSPGVRASYAALARDIAAALVRRGLGLVYGGASVGVMGVVADAVLQAGGRAVGVIPRPLVEKELAHRKLSELRITESMHERKSLMAELADAFVALPGGLGTLDELFEIWTWAQLGLHSKPCGLLDCDQYYQGLVSFLDHATREGFVRPQHRAMLLISTDADDLLDQLIHYEPPATQSRLRTSQT